MRSLDAARETCESVPPGLLEASTPPRWPGTEEAGGPSLTDVPRRTAAPGCW